MTSKERDDAEEEKKHAKEYLFILCKNALEFFTKLITMTKDSDAEAKALYLTIQGNFYQTLLLLDRDNMEKYASDFQR